MPQLLPVVGAMQLAAAELYPSAAGAKAGMNSCLAHLRLSGAAAMQRWRPSSCQEPMYGSSQAGSAAHSSISSTALNRGIASGRLPCAPTARLALRRGAPAVQGAPVAVQSRPHSDVAWCYSSSPFTAADSSTHGIPQHTEPGLSIQPPAGRRSGWGVTSEAAAQP